MAYNLKIDAKEVMANLKNLDGKSKIAIEQIANTCASNMETFAKDNGPWTDRTGDARRLLSSKAEMDENEVSMAVFHQVDYGLWLEVREAFDGRYKVLEDARDSQVSPFKSMLRGLKL